jgi:KEOPS complex subunit Pcc1
VGEIDDARSAARVDRPADPDDGARGRTVRVGIDAADLVALRAGTNTWIRLLDVAERVARTAARHRDDP